MEHFMDSHYFSLPSQGNVYTLSNLKLVNGMSKLLVASLKREIYCFEYLKDSRGYLIPTSKEISFTYIPTGAEIISIDAYNKSMECNEFVIGVTIIKNSNDSDTLETYLNIYSRWEASEDFNIENIAQNCLNVELNFIPYRLMHTDLMIENQDTTIKEKVFLLTGSDNQLHVYSERNAEHLFKEIDSKEYFPEFNKQPSPIIWMDILLINNGTERLTVFACECGYLKLAKVCVKSRKILFNFSTRLDNYISHVHLYMEEELKVNLIAVNTILSPVIFMDVLKYGLSNYFSLPRHNSTNVSTCCIVADVDLDGKLEILIGNSANEVLMYKFQEDRTWCLEQIKQFASPVLNIKYTDVIGDGVKELIVFTAKGVHVLQHDPEYIQDVLNKKFEKMDETDYIFIEKLISTFV